MATTIFFIGACIALIAAAFMLANSERQDARKAGDLAHAALDQLEHVTAAIQKIQQTQKESDEAFNNLVGTILKNNDMGDRLSARIDDLERLKRHQPPPLPQKIIVTQEVPFKVIYKEVRPKPVTSVEIPAQQFKKIKKQLNELSK